ncbi:hypothetical protein AB0L34_14940, partial [Micromonospora sp. NPDC052213]|uniref:hypothetical protein n=1 Tax=Micromonospora sp. NPDC052213 TaxID=3155812 RepID=UPI0034469E84
SARPRRAGPGPRRGWAEALGGGYPSAGPPRPPGRSTPAERGADPLLALLAGLMLGVSVLAVSGARAGFRAGNGPWLPTCLAALGATAWALLAVVWPGEPHLWLALLAWLPVLLGVLLFALVPAWSRGASGRWTLEVLLATALTLALTALPLVGWLYGRPAYTRTALLLAAVATVPGLLLGWRAARLVGASAEPVDPPWPTPRPAGPPR